MSRIFNGTSDYLLTGSAFTIGDPCTIEFWAKVSTNTSQLCFTGSFDDGSSDGIQILTNFDGSALRDNATYHYFRDATPITQRHWSADGSFYDGSWHHFLIERNDGTIAVRVDDSASTVTSVDTGTGIGPQVLQYPLAIAARNLRGVIDSFCPVQMYDFCIWNRTLTAGEKTSRAAGEEITTTSLVLRYKMDSAGSTETDLSTSSNNGTYTGSTFSTDDPVSSASSTATWQLFPSAGPYLDDGTINVSTHTFKARLLSDSYTTDPTDTVLADTTGALGTDQTVTLSTSGGTVSIASAVSWTGALTDVRHILLYDDTPTSPADPLLAIVDLGANQSVPTSTTFTLPAGDVYFR